jgi:nicotinate-nucleotide adenylyltransferase
MPSRIGVFGGTFDPVHLGHLLVAEQCREQAALDRVRFIPAARPPHKQGRTISPMAQRVEMLALALAGQPAFCVDDLEKDRPGPSFTADTLAVLHEHFPDAHLLLIIGSDCLPDLVSWREPARIGQLAKLLVVSRPGWEVRPGEPIPASWNVPPGIEVEQVIQSPLVDISSHDLRRRVSLGKSLRYMVPAAVACYIEAHGLYRVPA